MEGERSDGNVPGKAFEEGESWRQVLLPVHTEVGKSFRQGLLWKVV